MEDAIRATINIMDAPKKDVKIRSSYNLAGVSFAPEDVAQSIQKVIPEFEIEYEPDFRQAIADSWPGSIDDSEARKDWGWEHKFDLDAITKIMLDNLKLQYS
jgi:nucleoside-diphosphate-sugar epimerase